MNEAYRKRGIHSFEPAVLTPIPLREGRTVFIQGLPLDLTGAEAAKICRVVTTLATPLSETLPTQDSAWPARLTDPPASFPLTKKAPP